MSDEHEHRRDPARGASEPDETRQFSPSDDDDRTGPFPAAGSDETRTFPAAADDRGGSSRAPGADETRPFSASDDDSTGSSPAAGGDETRRFSPVGDERTGSSPAAGGDETRRFSSVGDERTGSSPAAGGDETRQFSPFDDDEATPAAAGNHPDGGTRSDDADATRVVPPVAATPPPRDATAVMPAAQDWNSAPDSVWAGRAEVRAPGPARLDDTAADWTAIPADEPRGRWWMPILVGIVALILIALAAWGIYLIAQNTGDDTPTPPATASAPPATTVPATTEPTTTPPTTTPTTTEPTGPREVTVPALIGLSREEAQQALTRRGLGFREILRSSDAAPGTVIDSDPTEGQEVPPDTRVTLVIAAEPTAPPTTATTTATTTTPTGEAGEDEGED